MDYRVVFMGSPEFALPTLDALANNYQVVGVVTQPDRPAGRGKNLKPPPIKTLATMLGIEVIQPERLRETEAQDKLASWRPDVIVVAAFGQILRSNVLSLPKYGCINVHASLLPRWRGAAPIQAAILAGDEVTGVTIMKMDAGIDTGAILSQEQIAIDPRDTAGVLSDNLAMAGARLLLQTLPGYLNGEIQSVSQDENLATYARMLKKEDGELKFDQSAVQLERLVRAFQPWPGAFFNVQGEMLKVLQARTVNNHALDVHQRGVVDGLPAVGTAEGTLVLMRVQPAGKKPMPGDVFLRGARGWKN